MGERGFLDVFRTFLRIILVIVNIIVTLLGVLVLIVGIWSEVSGKVYFEISTNAGSFSHIPVLIIVIGIFIALLGIVGIIGGILANTILGRIILGLYGFILALLVIIEIAGGIAAGVEKDNLSNGFEDSVNQTFMRYFNDTSIQVVWDTVQQGLQCCGTSGYAAYGSIVGNTNKTVARSCCKDMNNDACNPTVGNPGDIFTEGCTMKVRDAITHNLGVIAAIAIVFGLLQIVGIVVSCFVAIAGRESEGKYQVV